MISIRQCVLGTRSDVHFTCFVSTSTEFRCAEVLPDCCVAVPSNFKLESLSGNLHSALPRSDRTAFDEQLLKFSRLRNCNLATLLHSRLGCVIRLQYSCVEFRLVISSVLTRFGRFGCSRFTSSSALRNLAHFCALQCTRMRRSANDSQSEAHYSFTCTCVSRNRRRS